MPVPLAIEIAFDPVLRLGDLQLRWQTIGVSVALLVALAAAALIGGYLPGAQPLLEQRALHRPVRRWLIGAAYPPAPADPARVDPLRLEDMVFICLAIVPGAVAGGRLVHGITFADAYLAEPQRLLDPGTGSLSLLGSVVGGVFSAAWICRLLGAPMRRWADAAAVPMLLALGLGKLAQLLGGSGQGAAFNGAWAFAFVGDGPWIAADAHLPAHPAQLYEGLWLLLGIPLLLALAGPGADLGARLGNWRRLAGRTRSPGTLFVAALAWFLVGRVVVGFSWRDDRLVGPLNAEQFAAVVLLLALLLLVAAVRRLGPATAAEGRSVAAGYRDAVQNDR